MRRFLYFLLAVLCFAYYLWIGLHNYFTLSLLPAWLAFAILFLILGLLPERKQPLPRWLKVCFAAVLIAVLVVEGFIFSGMLQREQPELDCLIVLGAALDGEEPTPSLEFRLERALDYLTRYPQTAVIVSGGKGTAEVISEAEAMKRWLTDRGVAEDRIRVEMQSTRTSENLRFSFAMLKPEERRIGVVTNNFHIFRSVGIARRLAGDSLEICGLPARFSPTLLPHYLMREFCSVCIDTWKGNLQWF